VPLRAGARLPHHERNPRLHLHAALPGHRIPPATQALAARGAQNAARGAPVDGRRGARRRHRRCACGARGHVGRGAGYGEGIAGQGAHGRVQFAKERVVGGGGGEDSRYLLCAWAEDYGAC
jgi:hypothetical protein